MKKHHQNMIALGNQPIGKLLWQYFLPAFAGVIINSLYNIVDRIFIGQGVGAFALAGLSAVFPIMLIMMAFGMLIGMGAGVRISINLGRKDLKRAELVLGNAFVLMVIVAIFITGLGFAIKDPMLRIFGTGPDTYQYANQYLNIILLGSIFNIVGFSMNNLIRSEGNAKVAMYSMLISAGTNLVLDPIFIFGLHMGVAGAAWATIISQAILCIWVIAHFTSKRAVLKLRLINFKVKKEIILYIITIGFAPFFMQLAASVVQGAFNTQLVKYGGDIAIGAMGIINSVSMLLVMSIIAINMAAQPIIGFNHGAKNHQRVKETLIMSIKAATAICLGGFLLVQLFPGAIIRLFNTDNVQLLQIGRYGLRIFLAAMPLIGFQIITGNYFQSTGKAKTAAILSLLRQVLVLIPVLLILPHYLGLSGIWLAAPISDFIAAVIVFVLLIKELKRLDRAIEIEKVNHHEIPHT